MSERIVLTDGDQRAALALARAFGRAGHAVFVAGPTRRSLAGASRFVREQAAVADALHEPDRFVEQLAALCRRWEATVLIPVAEPAALAVLAARSRFGAVLVPFPDLTHFRAICDKAEVLRAAATLGIAVPAQRVVASPGEIGPEADAVSQYPVVLKPARSVSGDGAAGVKLSVTYAANRTELEARLREIPAAAYPVLLQQRVTGPGMGIFLLRWGGRTIARFAHRRLREKPPSGGVSVYRESVPADAALLAQSEALLAHFGWEGVAMVEYKVDRRTGAAYLMEINGRFWGSLQLAVDAGVDFPNLLLAAARGAPPARPPEYRSGIRLRWWWGEVDHLAARLLHSDAELHLASDEPSRWRAILAVLLPWRPGDRAETFRWDDPWPFARETMNWFRGR